MEHSCEAYWTKAEGLARDAICTMGLGAKRLTDAAKRQLEIADLRAGVNSVSGNWASCCMPPTPALLRIPSCCWKKCGRSMSSRPGSGSWRENPSSI